METQVKTLRHGERPEERINKMFGRATPDRAFASMGYDGATEKGFFDTTEQFAATRYGTRQKSLGIGELFQDVMLASDPRLWARVDGGLERVSKRLEKRRSKPITKASGLLESAGTVGGYTVPVQFYMELLRLLAEESFTRNLVTIIPMQTQTMMVPALLQSLSPPANSSAFFAGLQASFYPEGSTLPQTQPNFREIQLVCRNLTFTCVASNQLLQDNAVALDTLLTTLFKEAMGWWFDWYVLRGNGSNAPLGIFSAPATLTTGPNSGARTTANNVIYDDLAYLYSRLLPSSYKTAVWVCHPSVLYQLLRMTEDATSGTPSGGLTFLPRFTTDNTGTMIHAVTPMIFGLPLIISEKMSKLGTAGDIGLIDFAKVVVGDRMAIQIEASPHYLFATNQLMWRVIQRWDAQPWLNAPVTLADGSYTVSPFVLLN